MGNLKVDRLRYPVQFRPFSTKAREHNCSRAFVLFVLEDFKPMSYLTSLIEVIIVLRYFVAVPLTPMA